MNALDLVGAGALLVGLAFYLRAGRMVTRSRRLVARSRRLIEEADRVNGTTHALMRGIAAEPRFVSVTVAKRNAGVS